MQSGLEVAVVGASGVVGEQVLAALATSRFAGAEVTAFASRACKVEEVSYGDSRIPIRDLSDVAEHPIMLAFLCVPPHVAERVAPSITGRGALVVDVGGGSGMDLPCFLPGVSSPEIQDVVNAGGLRTPSAAGWVLASVLAPLREMGVTGVSGALNLSASSQGRAAMDELGSQVVAMFNSQEPPRKIFAEGLAFDVLPEDCTEDEWSDRELQAAAEVEALLGIPSDKIAVSLATIPLFSGVVGALHIRGLGLEEVEQALRDEPGLRAVARAARLRPRAIVDKLRTGVSYGRLRADPAGDGVHLWVLGDNLMGAGGAVPVAAAEWLLSRGLLTRSDA